MSLQRQPAAGSDNAPRLHLRGARRLVACSALAGLAAAAAALAPAAAAASCAAPVAAGAAVASAPVVFVGTVTGLDSGGRVATVHVDDVWKGTGVPAEVHVTGSPDLSAAATSVDRTYVQGQQYLFVPEGGSGTEYRDNECTATQQYSATLAALRPASAPGAATAAAGGLAAVPVAATAAVVLVAAAGVWLLLRRRRRGLAAAPGRAGS